VIAESSLIWYDLTEKTIKHTILRRILMDNNWGDIREFVLDYNFVDRSLSFVLMGLSSKVCKFF